MRGSWGIEYKANNGACSIDLPAGTAHAAWFGGWISLNMVRGARAFDPYPFPFLTFVVSLEAIFLSLFILMSQNRATRQADVRSHLDLQINLLAEQEATKMLQLLQQLW